METNAYWYVVYTRPRGEKKISSALTEKGIENYCPLNRVHRQWSDRKKVVLEPLFKGYLFIKVNEDRKWDVKMIDGIVNYVYWLGKPARVRDEEIEKIKKFLAEFEEVEVIDNQLEKRDAVVVNSGVFIDYKGIVIEVAGNRAKVLIDSMGVKLTAVFDKKNLKLVDII
jgi:transcription antitermination factor NusG